MSLLEVRGLSKTFSRRRGIRLEKTSVHAVSDVSFEVEAGTTLGLIGESGAGKSTAGRLVIRLINPDSGSVTFDGVDLLALSKREMRRQRANMQMVFQDPYSSLDPRVTVGTSVGEPLLIHQKLPRAERDEQVAALLKRVGLSSRYMNRYPRELSGGMLQRAAIARALTTSPKLIICDEPVAALDVLVRAQVLNLMLDLQAEFGLAYLFITHDLSLLRVLADEVCVMRHGRIVERGTVDGIFAHPQHEYSKELVAAIPRMTPKVARTRERDVVETPHS
jgi:peptide/nickel transport system ATP-binding protein/oligopeptide transport system ATP-binding protein